MMPRQLFEEAPYRGRRAVLATMHGKEQAIGPPMRRRLGLELVGAPELDTDRFGTFAGDVPRNGTMLEVAVRKAREGMRLSQARLGLASEGTYGPHPDIPFMTVGREIIVLVDDDAGLTVHEHLITHDVTCTSRVVEPGSDWMPFLDEIGFPAQGVLVRSHQASRDAYLRKDLRDAAEVAAAVAQAARLSEDGRARIETDMRAHRNPSRMAVLATLAEKLAHRIATPCPACRAPGFGMIETHKGLPCSECGTPTASIRLHVHGCLLCEFRDERGRPDGRLTEEAYFCSWCNP